MSEDCERAPEWPVAPVAGKPSVETRENGVGQLEYRHVYRTEWRVAPLP